ncbi:hypothetical protein C8F04DRAFT_947000 [Mycena alexandri]|uniref:Uncharacterized protein n=1 Tax=Mycena alexandri TaxID=1745969 RepID=A0AAD6X9C9_9AGAR|nr:hypothetical protein C8F04DRAFT_947000 [Mycena alexandri]
MLITFVYTIICFAAIPSVLASKPIIFRDLPCKFSLAASDVTRHNANSTGAPLVLGQFSGVADGATYEVTSTYASYPCNIYPTLSLTNGSLRAYRASGAWLTNATAVTSGGLLSWYTSPLFDHGAASVYTAVHRLRSARLPVLAAYGLDDLWYLCPQTGTPLQTSVFFDVSKAHPNSNEQQLDHLHKCWNIKLHLVPILGPREFPPGYCTRTNNHFAEC